MSQADELLETLSSDDMMFPEDMPMEEHIVVGDDRYITVPEALKRVAVQYDHDVETVTFDCPRYWDGLDMSTLKICINYRCPDNSMGAYIAKNVRVDDSDSTIMHFDWTISRNLTNEPGAIAFLICIRNVDLEGNEINHWNSEINTEMYISKGLSADEIIEPYYSDLMAQLLAAADAIPTKLSEFENDAGYITEDDVPAVPTKLSEFENDAGYIAPQNGLLELSYSSVSITAGSISLDAPSYGLSVSNNRIEYTGDPIDDTDAANKRYVDKSFSGTANPIVKTKRSEENILRIDNISPTKHSVNVVVSSKNLFDGTLLDGIISNGNFYIENTGTKVYKTIKVYLHAGRYVLEFHAGIRVNIVRKFIDGIYTVVNDPSSVNVNAYVFETFTDGYVGFTFRDATSSDTVWTDCPMVIRRRIDDDDDISVGNYYSHVNPATVMLHKYGKNLFPFITDQSANGVTLTRNGDHYVLNGTATGSGLFVITRGLPSGIYTLSANNQTHNGIDMAIVQVYSDTTKQSMVAKDNAVNSTMTLELTAAPDYQFRIRYENGITYNNFIIKPQLELNDEATEFEQYTHEEYSPNEHGEVIIDSIAPTMTLFANNDGVGISVEYHSDLNKELNSVVGDIESALDGIITIQNTLMGGESA